MSARPCKARMFVLRTSTSLSALGLVIGIAGTSWLTALTYERAPATRPLAEVIMPGSGSKPSLTSPAVSASRSEATLTRSASVPVTRVSDGTARAMLRSPQKNPAPVLAQRGEPAAEPLVPVYMPSPRYPMSALRANREGRVVLSVTVTPEGGVTEVTVGRSSGDLDLDHAAEDAVRNWRFAAADDRPSRYTTDLPIRFELTRPY